MRIQVPIYELQIKDDEMWHACKKQKMHKLQHLVETF